MKKIVFVLIMLLFYSALAQAEEPDIRLVTGLAPPFVHDKNGHNGFFNALMEEAFSRIGKSVIIDILPAARVLKNVDDGVDDGCVLRVAGLENTYPNMIMIPEPVFHSEFVGFHTGNISGDIDKIDLEAYYISYINGWKIFENHFKNHRKTLLASSPEQLFEILTAGRVDIIFYEKWQGLYISNLLKISSIELAAPSIFEVDQYMYLNRKHSDIVPLLADALKQIKLDGTYKRLYRTYLEDFLLQ